MEYGYDSSGEGIDMPEYLQRQIATNNSGVPKELGDDKYDMFLKPIVDDSEIIPKRIAFFVDNGSVVSGEIRYKGSEPRRTDRTTDMLITPSVTQRYLADKKQIHLRNVVCMTRNKPLQEFKGVYFPLERILFGWEVSEPIEFPRKNFSRKQRQNAISNKRKERKASITLGKNIGFVGSLFVDSDTMNLPSLVVESLDSVDVDYSKISEKYIHRAAIEIADFITSKKSEFDESVRFNVNDSYVNNLVEEAENIIKRAFPRASSKRNLYEVVPFRNVFQAAVKLPNLEKSLKCVNGEVLSRVLGLNDVDSCVDKYFKQNCDYFFFQESDKVRIKYLS